MPIPKILHQIWIGDAPQHSDFVTWRARWKELHPDWQFKLWTGAASALALDADNERITSHFPDLLAKASYIGQCANIFRLEILFAFGGIYIDTDVEPRRNIEPLLTGHEAVVSRMYNPEPDGSIRHSNAFLGAAPGHPFVKDALDHLRERDPVVRCSMGDPYVTELMRHHPEIHVIDRNHFLFFRQQWKVLGVNFHASPEVYAIHHWSHAWYPTIFNDPHACQGKA